MMARRGMMGLLAGGIAALLSGCSSIERKRYRMTVEVDTPEGVKSAFAVREVVVRRPPPIPMLGEDRGSVSVRGEAVAVDLPGGQVLFALLTGQDNDVDYAGSGIRAVFRVMDRDIGPEGGPHELWPKVPRIREPITDPVPMLVRFRDLNDPTSVERVDPADLAASFGPGVRLKRITVAASDEAVTVGIGERLRWLGHLQAYRTQPSNPFTSTLPREIGGLRSR